MNKTIYSTLIATALACTSVAFAQNSTSTGGGSGASQAGENNAQTASGTSGTTGTSQSGSTTGGTSGAASTGGTSGTTGGTIDDQSGISANGTAGSRTTNVASNASSTSFDALDTGHRGYLMPSDLSANRQLSGRFASCDTNGDGRLSREEYNACLGTSGTIEQ